MFEREVFAIVVRVAFYARCSRNSRLRKARMKAPILLDFIRNFAMAIGTPELCGLAGDRVTFDAVRGAAQSLVRPGKWTRGNLCTSREGK